MTEYIKETVVTRPNQTSPVIVQRANNSATGMQTIEYLIYFGLGIIETLLAFRLILKFMGAGARGAFVGLIYTLSNLFILPFEGIFRRGFNEGIETTSIFEPSVLVAIIVYAILAWGIVALLRILSGEKQNAE